MCTYIYIYIYIYHVYTYVYIYAYMIGQHGGNLADIYIYGEKITKKCITRNLADRYIGQVM